MDQSLVRWAWNLRPLNRGDQVINLGVDIQQRSSDSSAVTNPQLWRAQLPIYVEQPLITTGGQVCLIRLTSAITAALGTTLVLPLLSRIVLSRAFRGET
jgi:hypothetical protein